MTTPAIARVLGPAGWAQRHPQLVDVLFAAPFLLFWLALTLAAGRGTWIAVVSAIQVFPLVVRRRWPTAVYAAVSLGCLLQLVTLDHFIGGEAAFLVAQYTIAAHGRHERLRRAALGVGVLAGTLPSLVWGRAVDTTTAGQIFGAVLLTIVATVCWVGGDLMRQRRQVVAALAEQNAALLRDREQRERLATQAERARIAREMHDIVAHNLSVIVVQADGAGYAARHSPADAEQRARIALDTLDTIARTARASLAETRRLVGVLREPADTTDYAPTAGLDQVSGLVESVRASGLAVDLDLPEPLPSLPRDGDLAAYRVVQEGLTNVLKHAGPRARARVSISEQPTGLTIEVADDGRGAAATAPAAPGHGLVGMRERVAAAGGSLRAGPADGGGYALTVRLPTAGHLPTVTTDAAEER